MAYLTEKKLNILVYVPYKCLFCNSHHNCFSLLNCGNKIILCSPCRLNFCSFCSNFIYGKVHPLQVCYCENKIRLKSNPKYSFKI